MSTRVVAVLLLCLAATLPAEATWTRGGLYGADVRAMALDSDDPDRVYLGTSHGEIYRSDDGGESWTNPRGVNPFPGFVIDNLVVDARSRVWVAAWGLWGGGLVAVSEDQGRSWERRDAGIADESIRAFARFASDPDVLFAGSLTGVFRSRDDGTSWERISELPNIHSLGVDPRNENRILAGTFRQAYRTEDGGAKWALSSEGMVLDTDIFTITIDPKAPDSIWIATCGWLYHSANAGRSWTRHREGFDNRRVHDVAIDPIDRRRVLAGSVAGLYRSANRGASWSRISDENFVINSILVTAARPGRIIVGTEGDGVYRSNDDGRTFERTSRGLHNVRVAAIAPDPVERGHLYAAVIFGNAASGVYRSIDGGSTWARWSAGYMPEVLALFVQESGPARFIAGTEKGIFISGDGIQWRETTLLPLRVEKFAPYGESRLFAATSEGVYTSRDRGETWYALRRQSGGVLDLAIGRFRGETALYVLVADGLEVFDGREWWKIRNLPPGVRSIDFHQVGGIEGVVIAIGHQVWVGSVRDGTWELLSGDAELARKVWTASEIDRVIMATTRSSARAFAGGEGWRTLTLPVQERAISAIAADPSEPARLYLGTHGDGLYILRTNHAAAGGVRSEE